MKWVLLLVVVVLAVIAAVVLIPRYPPTDARLVYAVPEGTSLATGTFESLGDRWVCTADRADKRFLVLDGVAQPEDRFVTAPGFSDGASHFAQVAHQRRGRLAVLVDGVAQKECDEIDRFWFSPRGTRYAYLATSNGKISAVVDGKAERPYDYIQHVAFSEDDKHYGYGAIDGKDIVAIVDGKEVYRSLVDPSAIARYAPSPRFSPSGDHYAFILDRSGKTTLVVDGRVDDARHPPYSGGDLVFSRTGRRMAYEASAGAGLANDDGRVRLVVDAVPGNAYHYVTKPAFSPDERCVAYIANRHTDQPYSYADFVIVGDREYGPYDEVGIGGGTRRFRVSESNRAMEYGPLFFTPDSRRLMFTARRGEQCFVVVDGVEGSPYDRVTAPTISADGKHIAYAATSAGTSCAVLDGKEQRRYDRVSDLCFTAAGNHFVYMAQKGARILIVIDGKERPFDKLNRGVRMLGSTTVWNGYMDHCYAISADGEHVAWEERDGDTPRVMLDGKPVGDGDPCYCPVFADRGGGFAYIEHHKGRYRVVVNGRAHAPVDLVLSLAPGSGKDGSFVWYGVTGQASLDRNGIERLASGAKLYRYTARSTVRPD